MGCVKLMNKKDQYVKLEPYERAVSRMQTYIRSMSRGPHGLAMSKQASIISPKRRQMTLTLGNDCQMFSPYVARFEGGEPLLEEEVTAVKEYGRANYRIISKYYGYKSANYFQKSNYLPWVLKFNSTK